MAKLPKLTWDVDKEVVALTLLAAAEVPNFLAGALPSFMTIGRFAAEQEDRDRLVSGMWYGSLLALMIGVGAGLAGGSWWPIAATLVVLAVMLHGYNKHMHTPNKDATPINLQDTGPIQFRNRPTS
jgi:hypothetical protein